MPDSKPLLRSVKVLCAGSLPLLLLVGCNLLTGADDLKIDGRQQSNDGDDGDGGGAGVGQTGGPTGGPGPSTGNVTSAETAATGATTGVVEALGDARGVTITEVSFYQGIKSRVMQNGSAANPRSPIVANRPALVRVFTSVSSPSGAPITARLTVGSNPPIEVSGQATSSSEEDGGSTFNFDVPAAQIQKGGGFRIELLEPVATSMPNAGARYPADGQAPLSARAGHPVKVTLIPVRWGADGSNRVPDTSAGTVALYRDQLMKWYPASEAIVTVGAAINWNQSVSPSSVNGWGALLDEISNRRSNANVDLDEFYFGIFDPAASFGAFCGGGCIAGLGNIGDPQSDYTHASIGLGFGGQSTAEILAHEIGHNHGRNHSPCGGADGADPGYPNSNGDIGEWGFDILTSQLYPPNGFKDFMGYCQPQWISYYTYNEMLDFKTSMQGAAVVVPPELQNLTYQKILVYPDHAEIGAEQVLARPMLTDEHQVEVTTSAGTDVVRGNFVRWDHADGGVLFVRKGAHPIQEIAFDLRGDGVNTPALRRVRAVRPAAQ